MGSAVCYISHGEGKTGGYRHEQIVAGHIAGSLNETLTEERLHGAFKGIKGFLALWSHAFRKAGAPVVITVQRMALPVILRSFFSRSKVIIVFHHYDEREKRNIVYHLNAWLLFGVLSLGLRNVRVVTVAPFWRDFLLARGVPESCVTVIPNLFDPARYSPFHAEKKKRVYFGQAGNKQHEGVSELVQRLHEAGYECFFTTPLEAPDHQAASYKVLHLDFEAYCRMVAASSYTVCFSAINEGWNRIAHESVLLGTTVIGNRAGGLGELLAEAGQLIAGSPGEVYQAIITGRQAVPAPEFISKYHISRISYYAGPITRFCKQ